MQFIYFAGCGGNRSGQFDLVSAGACWDDWQRLIDNLDALTYPLAALWLAVGGAIALGWGASASLVLANSHKSSSTLITQYPSGEGRLEEGAER